MNNVAIFEIYILVSGQGYQWLPVDAVDYLEQEFLILDENSNEKYYKFEDTKSRITI